MGSVKGIYSTGVQLLLFSEGLVVIKETAKVVRHSPNAIRRTLQIYRDLNKNNKIHRSNRDSNPGSCDSESSSIPQDYQ